MLILAVSKFFVDFLLIFFVLDAPNDLVNETDLLAYWRMDDNGGSTVTDYSGNGNHGTLESSNDNIDLPKWITI